MDYVQKVRDDYALRQVDLAQFLGLKRSSLAMGENGKRNILTREVRARLDALIDTFAAIEKEYASSKSSKPIPPLDKESIASIELLIQKLQRQLDKEERMLSTYICQQEVSKKALLALPILLRDLDLFPEKSFQREWLENQMRIHTKRIIETSGVTLVQLKASISSIKVKISILEEELNSINNT